MSCRDSGKDMVGALMGEVLPTCEKVAWVLREGERWLAPEHRSCGVPLAVHKTARVEYHPLGVVGVIAPWNYPFHNMLNHIVSGIFAGNAVVVKPSEWTSWSAQYYLRIVRAVLSRAGHDPELVQVVTGRAETGAALVSGSGVDKVVFTGSCAVGRHVMRGAAATLTPVVLELGGKDPCVLCGDLGPQLDDIAQVVLRGVFQNCGQNCIGLERIYVHADIYEGFVRRCAAALAAMRQGPTFGAGAGEAGQFYDCGALVMPAQLGIVQALVDDAVAKGARVLAGGKRNAKLAPGLFFEPTLLVDVDHSMRIAKEEVFGPVLTVVKWDGGDDDIVALVNDCPFGLGSSVFAEDAVRAARIAKRIRAGMSNVNDYATTYLCQSLPFGGVKLSGFGRFAGREGLRALTVVKAVTTDRFPLVHTAIPPPMQYPVKAGAQGFVKGLLSLAYAPSWLEKVRGVVGLLRNMNK